MNSAANRLLKVEPSRLSIDCCGLVFPEDGSHVEGCLVFFELFARRFCVIERIFHGKERDETCFI
jgi:hypothetical protein